MPGPARTESATADRPGGSRHAADAPVRAAARPEITPLDEEQRKRVHRVLRRRGAACPHCGNRRRWTVGDALHLGFLFLDEDEDAYMIAVTCRRRGCPRPRTGIIVHRADVLEP